MNGFDKLSQNAKSALKSSLELSKSLGTDHVGLEHLFVVLLQNKDYIASQVLRAFDIDYEPLTQKIMTAPANFSPSRKAPRLSEEIRAVIKGAYEVSKEYSHVYVGTEHLLVSILNVESHKLVIALREMGLSDEKVREKVLSIATYPPGLLINSEGEVPEVGESMLDTLGRDLTQLAEETRLSPMIGRDAEVDQMVHILSRRNKNNPVIVGEAGVGKTALVEGLAQRIVSGKVPTSLRNKRIVSVDTASIVAGSKVRGELEEKVLAIISELSGDENIILFIDEIHNILGAGSASGGSLDIADIFKPALASGDLRVIGATTIASYQHIFEEDSALSRRFQQVKVEEMSVDETIKVLKKIKTVYEEYHGVKVEDDAIEAVVKLSKRYIHDRFLPDKAIDILDNASTKQKLKFEIKLPDSAKLESKLEKLNVKIEKAMKSENLDKALELRTEEEKLQKKLRETKDQIKVISKSKRSKVDEAVVRDVLSTMTGIPLNRLSKSDVDAIRNIEKVLQKFIIGQGEAIDSVSKALKRSKVGISEANKPMASFLFLGPTGVGKSELSKVVATQLFGSEDNLVQIDMSEMMEPHSISKIIGAPPGYVGYQEGGQLTDKIRQRPYSVVLFDEIEKAHPDVLNILLQVLEYGQLTDSKGRVANFKNSIIIMTSNIGAEEISDNKALGFEVTSSKDEETVDKAYEEMKQILLDELKDALRPEFLNRLDDIVIFRSLTPKDAVEITKLLVGKVAERLKEKGYSLKIGAGVYKFITEKGFDQEYGARPLRRYIQDELEAVIADYMLENLQKKAKQSKTIKISKKGDKLITS